MKKQFSPIEIRKNGQGFWLTFENGYSISVQIGPYAYCGNYPSLNETRKNVTELTYGSDDCEIGIFDQENNLVSIDEFDNDTVKGYVTPNELLKWMNYAAGLGGT